MITRKQYMDNDTISIEPIIRNDGSLLVIARYNTILGDRWLWGGDSSALDEVVEHVPA